LNDAAKSSVVLDRELDEEKSQKPSDPRIRCPLCGWSPRKEDRGLAIADTNGTRSTQEELRLGESKPFDQHFELGRKSTKGRRRLPPVGIAALTFPARQRDGSSHGHR
jgi:hypothetical protein